MVCYRDGYYSLVSPGGAATKPTRHYKDGSDDVTERVAFLPGPNVPIWHQWKRGQIEIRSPRGVVLRAKSVYQFWEPLFFPSPNGRYLALASEPATNRVSSFNRLHVYDRRLKTWANLGPFTVSAIESWEGCKASWDPWFRDSSRLTFLSNGRLMVCSPDGKQRTVICTAGPDAGVPAASPDGSKVAFVAFQPYPKPGNQTHKRFPINRGSRIWVVPVGAKQIPTPATTLAKEDTYCVRWLTNAELVFDRIGEGFFLSNARLWRVRVPASPPSANAVAPPIVQ
jgi:hypothetical protein